jgi:tol-pal system protein YbgF
MKNFFLIPMACCLLTGGCASGGQVKDVENTGKRHERMLYETEQRLSNLEQNVNSLNGKVENLNHRSYEVLTGSGKKSGMKVVPVPAASAGNGHYREMQVTAREPQKNSAPEPQISAVAVQTAPILSPASVPPLPLPTDDKFEKKNTLGTKVNNPDKIVLSKSQKIVGPSGSLGVSSDDTTTVALPPAILPVSPEEPRPGSKSMMPVSSSSPAVPASAGKSDSIPVPHLPPVDLALPPEHPILPPPAQASQAAALSVPLPAGDASPIVPDKGQQSGTQTPRTAKQASGSGQEEAAYKTALDLAMSGRTAEGINQFRNFLQDYPNGRYAANAEYWIGECLYAQRNYKDALAQFQLVNMRYASHHKNADALLKAGITLSKIGDKQGATEKYRILMTDFPNSEAAKRVRKMGLAH